jgi:NADPH2:quinone reductase
VAIEELTDRVLHASSWKELLALYETGLLKPVIGGRFHMEQVADAMGFLASRKAVGKVVLHW